MSFRFKALALFVLFLGSFCLLLYVLTGDLEGTPYERPDDNHVPQPCTKCGGSGFEEWK